MSCGRTTNARMTDARTQNAKTKTPGKTQWRYQSGFGNEFASEAVEAVLPRGQNSPQSIAHGLYAEQLSGTAFTAPRGLNRRTWLYRMRPSVAHKPFEPIGPGRLRSAPFDEVPTPPNQLRWGPIPIPASSQRTDFIDGLITMAGNGNTHTHSGVGIHIYVANASMTDRFFPLRPPPHPTASIDGLIPRAGNGNTHTHSGVGIHIYVANASMTDRFFYNADGEMLIVPQMGRLLLRTEMGVLEAGPGEIAVIQRGIRFRVELLEKVARGYICENYGALLRLPDLGPIGANGLANPRDFLAPIAEFEDREGDFRIVTKFQGRLWAAAIDHSPLNVVAWHGNYVPYKYDLANFNCINTVSFDHPDPSIYTVLTSPSEISGTANVDFAIFPPRWMVSEHTFRPPWFHRNFMNEFRGLIRSEER